MTRLPCTSCAFYEPELHCQRKAVQLMMIMEDEDRLKSTKGCPFHSLLHKEQGVRGMDLRAFRLFIQQARERRAREHAGAHVPVEGSCVAENERKGPSGVQGTLFS